MLNQRISESGIFSFPLPKILVEMSLGHTINMVSNCIYHGCVTATLSYKRDELYAATINIIKVMKVEEELFE